MSDLNRPQSRPKRASQPYISRRRWDSVKYYVKYWYIHMQRPAFEVLEKLNTVGVFPSINQLKRQLRVWQFHKYMKNRKDVTAAAEKPADNAHIPVDTKIPSDWSGVEVENFHVQEINRPSRNREFCFLHPIAAGESTKPFHWMRCFGKDVSNWSVEQQICKTFKQEWSNDDNTHDGHWMYHEQRLLRYEGRWYLDLTPALGWTPSYPASNNYSGSCVPPLAQAQAGFDRQIDHHEFLFDHVERYSFSEGPKQGGAAEQETLEPYPHLGLELNCL